MTSIDKSIAAAEIREIFQNQHDNLESDEGRKVIISHLGTFSQDLVSSLSSSTEELLVSSGDNRLVVKRLFSILIEGLQNIRLHGEKDGMGRQLGYLLIGRGKNDYRVIMANVICSEDQVKVEKYLEKINHYTMEELREAYLSVLSNEFLSQKGGAGLGFITTRMKSGNPLRHSFYALKNDKMLFSFDVHLSRVIS